MLKYMYGLILAVVAFFMHKLQISRAKVTKAEIEKDIADVEKKIAESSLDELVDGANKRRKSRR